MANSFLSELGRRMPQIALGILAARQGGPEAAAAFMGGLSQAEQAREARARQAQLDEERRQAQAAQETRAQSAEQRAQEASARAADDQRLQRLQAALSYLQNYEQQVGQTATDPTQAENALLGRASSLEGMFNVPQGQLSGAIPNMTPVITGRKKRQAQDLYDRAEKLYGAEALANDSVTLQTGELFGDIKPSALRALYAPQAVTSTGEPAKPLVGKPDVPNTPEEQFYATYAAERNTTWEKLPTAKKAAARKSWMQADDRPSQGATVVIQTVDAQGNPVTRIVPKTAGAEFAAPATGAQRQQTAENTAVLTGLNRLRELAPTTGALSAWVGPVQGRVNALKLATPGMDVDPEMAEFFAETAAIKNRMIRAITGAQMSEPEAKRIMAQLPDINHKPGVFLARMAATERNLKALNAAMAAKTPQGSVTPTAVPALADPLGIR